MASAGDYRGDHCWIDFCAPAFLHLDARVVAEIVRRWQLAVQSLFSFGFYFQYLELVSLVQSGRSWHG